MNLSEFPTLVTKQNDSLVEEFELMTAEMTNEGTVRLLTGFLVAKFHMYCESPKNYALREMVFEQMPKLQNLTLDKKDFIRGIVAIMERNGHVERVYDGQVEAQQPDRLHRLFMDKAHTPKKQLQKIQQNSMRMISQEQEKPINRMKSEEQRMTEKRELQRQSMNQMTKKKETQFQSKEDLNLTATVNKTKNQEDNHQKFPEESMGIAPKRLMQEYIDENMLEEDDLSEALHVITEMESYKKQYCPECPKLINFQDIGRLDCEHIFHRDCLTELIRSSIHLKRPMKQCPVLDCKKKISMDDIKMYIEGQELERYAQLLVLQKWNDVPLNTLHSRMKERQANQNIKKEEEKKQNSHAINQHKDQRKELDEKKQTKKEAEYNECPKCKKIVQKVSNNNEILCNCGARICLNCGGSWCNNKKCIYDEFSNVRPHSSNGNQNNSSKKTQKKK